MDLSHPGKGNLPLLTWGNVSVGFACILLDAVLSHVLDIGVEHELIVGATRCMVQLSIMGFFLEGVFEDGRPAGVAGIAGVLIVLGCFETVVNQSKSRFLHMFPSVLLAFICSSFPLSLVGSIWGIGNDPFWRPDQYIPIIGMITGNTITAIVIAISTTLREISQHRDETEVMLAYGATRYEACKPIARHAIQLSILPVVNQMSILGIISIPGLMTGAILGGSSVNQAAKLQMIMMFLVTSASTLSSIIVTYVTLSIIVDSDTRIRSDRIDHRRHILWRVLRAMGYWLWLKVNSLKQLLMEPKSRDMEESQGLLRSQMELRDL